MSGFKVIDNIMKFVEEEAKVMDRALNRMAVDVERLAKAKVPVKQGLLKASGRHRRVSFLRYWTEFNKEYAAYQEWGGDGKRTVKKYTTPGTGKFYLKNAGDTVKKIALKYVQDEASRIKI